MPVFGFLKKKVRPLMGSPASNDAVRMQLSAFGDDGQAERHVLHYAYPCKGADLSKRPDIGAALAARGFSVSDAAAKDGFVFEHHHAVDPDSFDPLTADLSAYFAERGWDYDGWECAVVSPAAQ